MQYILFNSNDVLCFVFSEEIASATTAPPEPATDPKPTTKF